eukprot:TRINITY_DN13485_c0_g1_i1.p1 TRINITY_DN13485_c0_g1~~TRINITY_DN13485_c0_g1_i1.p1  ORF type:complete len:1502 (+),score=533.36 TRINITY_DN13485_c0_g1_i1:41-4546(+)
MAGAGRMFGRRSGAPAPDMGWSEDVSVKIHQIRYVLRERIEDVKAMRRQQGDAARYSYTNSQYAKECGASEWVNEHSLGLPFDYMLDLKMAFDYRRTEGVGFSESEFVKYFAPVFCADTDPALIKIWFLQIDENADGRIDWDEFSAFLSKQCQRTINRAKPSLYATKCIGTPNPPLPLLHAINEIACNSALKELYTAASDGTVRIWDSNTLHHKGVLHYGNGSLVHTLKYMPQTNQLIVGQHDRSTFVYHCGTNRGTKKAKAQIERVYRGLKELPADSNGYRPDFRPYHFQMQRLCEFDPECKLMERGCGQGILGLQGVENMDLVFPQALDSPAKQKARSQHLVGNHYIDATVMCGLDIDVHCMEYLPQLGDSYPSPFIFGLENGAVQLWSLADKSGKSGEGGERTNVIHPYFKWSIHRDWVTHLMAAPDLGGFISSSLDNTVRVFDLEKEEVATKLTAPPTSYASGSGYRKKGGVYSFDYSADRNLLCSVGVSREALVWNPKAAQCVCTLKDQKSALVGAKFIDSMAQLVTLGEDKVIKVYDVRTLRVIQSLTDKKRQYPHDRHSALEYDKDTNTIVVGAGTPSIWRESLAQEKIETGSSFPLEYDGHILPVMACVYNSRMLQLVTADEQNVRIWDVKTGKTLAKWSPFKDTHMPLGNLEPPTKDGRLQRVSLDHDKRRLLLGYEGGAVDMCSLDGRRLKTFAPKTSFDMTSLTHIIANETTHAQCFVLVGGFRDKLLVWHDVPETTLYTTSQHIKRHILSTREGAVQSVVFFPPNKAVAGTVTGKIVLFSLNNFSVLSISDSVVKVGRQLAGKGRGLSNLFGGVMGDLQARRRMYSNATQLQQLQQLENSAGSGSAASPKGTRRASRLSSVFSPSKRGSAVSGGGLQQIGVPPRPQSQQQQYLGVSPSRHQGRPHTTEPASPGSPASPQDLMWDLSNLTPPAVVTSPSSPLSPSLGMFSMDSPRASPRDPFCLSPTMSPRLDGLQTPDAGGVSPRGDGWRQVNHTAVTSDKVELGFANFRAQVLSKMQVVIEKIVCIRGEYVVSLHGNGDCSMWRMMDGYSFRVLVKFPASFSPGELAHEMDFSVHDSLLYVADGEAKISVFDVSLVMADEGAEGAAADATPATKSTATKQTPGTLSLPTLTVDTSGIGSTGSTEPAARRAGQRQSINSMMKNLADEPQIVCGGQFINVHLIRFVTCHDMLFAQKITALQVLPEGSPVAVVTHSDCSMTIINRHTGLIYSRMGARVEPSHPWPTGLPTGEELNDPGEDEAALADGSRRPAHWKYLQKLQRKHRFALMFPEDDEGVPSPKASPRIGGGLKRGSKWMRLASAAGLAEEGKPLPAVKSDLLSLDPLDQVDLESVLSSPRQDGNDRDHNHRMYQRYCMRHEMSSHEAGSTFLTAAAGSRPQSPDTLLIQEVLTSSLQSNASTRIDAHLKSVQHRKKQTRKNPKTDHFAYTTVRRLRNIARPTFRKECGCAACKAFKGIGRAPNCERQRDELPF